MSYMYRWLTRASVHKACAVSLVVHVCALAALANWSLSRTADTVRIGAARGVVVFEATFSEPQPQPAIEATVAQDDVLILPDRAELARRQYVDTPADRVPLQELLTREALDRLAEAERDAVPVPAEIDKEKPRAAAIANAPPQAQLQLTRAPATREPVVDVKARRVSAPPTPQVESGIRTGPSFAGNRPPRYPELARRNGWQGQVLLRLTISESGAVIKVEVARTSGHAILDATAAAAVRTWRGTPATLDGRPVETVELLPVRFRLR